MNPVVKNTDLEEKIFAARPQHFLSLALEIFHFQYQHNPVYRQYCELIHCNPATITQLTQIPFLPISCFKTHVVHTTLFDPEVIFESSGTTGQTTSRHEIKSKAVYQQSFTKTFQKFYGRPQQWCIIGLLPSYLERSNSSLIMMVDELVKQSEHPLSGFYLYEHDKLHKVIARNELLEQPTLLIGVTYALLDFAAEWPMKLRHTTIMETGGMKGRREEMTRAAVHETLQIQLGVPVIHAEYGMTELLSQAYSKGNGFFHCPAWMQVLLRTEDDPLTVETPRTEAEKPATGAINIIDLANLYSCSFIATDDIGRLYADGSFEVLGRLDNSDIRGCSLLTI